MLMLSRHVLITAVISSLFAVYLGGCSPKFSCKEKIDGVTCNSITSTYNKEVNGELTKKGKKKKNGARAVALEDKDADIVKAIQLHDGKPLRVPPKIVRIWICPWEDSDGDLHQPEYIFSEISDKKGRWLFGEKGSSVATQIIAPTQREIPREAKEKTPENAK